VRRVVRIRGTEGAVSQAEAVVMAVPRVQRKEQVIGIEA
jgi:hypothetical protein